MRGKVGVIFDGGGFNGIYQVGAAKAIWQRGIKPDYVQGVSVGALNAAAILEHGSVNALENIWFGVERRGPSTIFPKWEATKSILRSVHSAPPSLLSGEGLWELIGPMKIVKIINSSIYFEIAVRNASKNNKHTLFSNRDLRFTENPELFRRVLAAATSIPGFFPRVEIDGEDYFDGLSYSIESAIAFGCDTIFIITVDHISDRRDAEWTRQMLQPYHIIFDEFTELQISETLRHHPDFELFDVQEASTPLLERLKETISKFVKSLVGNGVHRLIVPVIVRHASATISTISFQKGDFKPAIEQGYAQANIILDRLLAV